MDVTNATLQSWALSKGIYANVDAMTHAEKALLRYQYVMANTTAAQGDFARTSDSWHNVLVRLSQTFQQLGSVVGGVLINAFKPFMQALNTVMKAVITFAETVANALGAIFGWTIEIGSSGMVNDFQEAGIGAEDMADGVGNAASNAKKLQKTLSVLPFDQLNQLSKQKEPGSGGGGGGGSLGGLDSLGAGADVGIVKTDSLVKKYESEIKSLYELGKYINEALTKSMDSINWDSVYQGARNFGTGLADFLNGLISPELFGATGRTIAGALNTAIYAALSFGTTFDWKNFGLSIASGVNNFFATFDFASLAATVNTFAKGIFDTIITAIDNIDWKLIGQKIGTFISKIDFTEIGLKVGRLLWEKIDAGIQFVEGLFSAAPIETSIIAALAVLKFTGAGKAIAAKIALTLSTAFKESSVINIIKAQTQALLGNSAAASALAFMSPLAVKLTGIGTTIAGVTLSVSNFFNMWKNGFSWLNEAVMALGIGITALGAIILGAPAMVAGVVAGIVAAAGTLVVLIHDNWDAIKDIFSNAGAWFDNTVVQPIINFAKGLFNPVSEVFSKLWNNITEIWNKAYGWFQSSVIQPLENIFFGFSERAQQIFQGLWIGIQAIWSVVSEWFRKNVSEPITGLFQVVWESVSGFFFNLWDHIKSIWSVASDWFNGSVITPLKNVWEQGTNAIKLMFDGVWNSIKTGVVGAMNFVISKIENGVNFLIKGINSLIKGFNKIVAGAANIVGVNWSGVSLIPNVSIPRLAGGGIVTGPTLAFTGENFRKEAVLPLENKRTMSMIADSIMANSNASVNMGDMENAVARGVAMALMNNQGNNSNTPPIYVTVQLENDEAIARAAIRGQQRIDYRQNPTPRFAL